jgi:hypothetical protein
VFRRKKPTSHAQRIACLKSELAKDASLGERRKADLLALICFYETHEDLPAGKDPLILWRHEFRESRPQVTDECFDEVWAWIQDKLRKCNPGRRLVCLRQRLNDGLEFRPMRHPIFDPRSRYSRLRRMVERRERLRGYFVWLRSRSESANHDASRSGFHRDFESNCIVLLARSWEIQPIQDCRALCWIEVSPIDGGGDILRFAAAGLPANARCRAFIIERSAIDGLRWAEGSENVASDVEAIRQSFDAEAVRGNASTQRILSALPAIDAETDDSGRVSVALTLPDRFPGFPLGTQMLLIVDGSAS